MTRNHRLLVIAAAIILALVVAPFVFVVGTVLAGTATLLVPLILLALLFILRDRPAGRRTHMP